MNYQDVFIREVRVSYRPTEETPFKIRTPQDVAAFVRKILVDNSREHFIALYLSCAHEVACYSLVSIGTANSAVVHPREVFQRAISCGAVSLVVAHNHPAGQTNPSGHDLSVTQNLKKVGELLSIPLLDHVIVTDTECLSLMECGCM